MSLDEEHMFLLTFSRNCSSVSHRVATTLPQTSLKRFECNKNIVWESMDIAGDHSLCGSAALL